MIFETLIILALVLLNALFSISELAIVTAQKSRLKAAADAGSRRARIALELAEDPYRLLSTVQIGITLIGIIAGVYGGAKIAEDLEAAISADIPALIPYAYAISYGTVVVLVTYFSVVLGELVPKQLALAFPERIAVALAPLLRLTLTAFNPFIVLLDKSTRMVLKLIPVKIPEERAVTEEDVRSLIDEGAQQGVIESGWTEVLKRTLKLGDRPVRSIMTPRVDLVWINLEDSPKQIWSKMMKSSHTYFPVCRGRLENFVGILSIRALAAWREASYTQPIEQLVQQPIRIYPAMSILKALNAFRQEECHFALVIDERGSTSGIVTTHDLLEAIVGELPDEVFFPP